MKPLLMLLFSVSLSGTLPFIIYLIAGAVFRDKLSATIRYRFLKLCLLFYLVPFPFIKYVIGRKLDAPGMKPPVFDNYIYLKDVIQQTNDSFYILLDFPEKRILSIIGLIFFIIVFYYIIVYVKFRSKISHCSIPESSCTTLLMDLKDSFHIKSNVKVYLCNMHGSPATYGIFSPVILLTKSVNSQDFSLVFLHELQHIKNHDFFFRLLSMLAILLHCYNPFIYLFFRELKEVQELHCDEQLVVSFTPEEKKRYGDLLLQIGSEDFTAHSSILYFSKKRRKNFMRKRIFHLTKPDFKKSRLLLTFLTVCMVGSACIPVAAYSPVTIDWRHKEDSILSFDPNITWIYIANPETETEIEVAEDEINFKYADAYVILENGEIVLITQNADENSSRASCSHNYVSAVSKTHSKSPSGGCTVSTYDSLFCTKCRNVVYQDLTGLQYFKVCPH